MRRERDLLAMQQVKCTAPEDATAAFARSLRREGEEWSRFKVMQKRRGHSRAGPADHTEDRGYKTGKQNQRDDRGLRHLLCIRMAL